MPQLALLLPAAGAAGAAGAGVSLGSVATGALLAGTALQAFGQIQEGQTADAVAKYNAQVAEQEAEAARLAAADEAARIGEEGRRLRARQRTLFAAGGLDPGAGSALLVQQRSEDRARMDALTAIYRGEIGASRAESERNLIEATRAPARRASGLGAAATLLEGGSYAALSRMR